MPPKCRWTSSTSDSTSRTSSSSASVWITARSTAIFPSWHACPARLLALSEANKEGTASAATTMNLKRLFRGPALWIMLIVLAVWIGGSSMLSTPVSRIDTSDGIALLEQGKAEQAVIDGTNQQVDLTLTAAFGDKGKRVEFFYVTPQGPDVVAAVKAAKLAKGYNGINSQTAWWVTILGTFLPFLVIIGLFWFLMMNAQGGGSKVMSFGKSRAKLVSPEAPQVTFADVAGADEAV